VNDYISEYQRKHKELVIYTSFEETLLGSGGTIRENASFIKQDNFLICYADNLTDINISDFVRFHANNDDAILSMALFNTNLPKQCGIAEVNETGKVIEFCEKPDKPKSNLANAGVYIANKEILKYLPVQDVLDIGKDVLPKLVERGSVYGWKIKDYLIDIGNIENYNRAKEEWKYDYYENTTED
jgi:mannose-1-phosphate guanylyltransferase